MLKQSLENNLPQRMYLTTFLKLFLFYAFLNLSLALIPLLKIIIL